MGKQITHLGEECERRDSLSKLPKSTKQAQTGSGAECNHRASGRRIWHETERERREEARKGVGVDRAVAPARTLSVCQQKYTGNSGSAK